jgi:hypothetical protein
MPSDGPDDGRGASRDHLGYLAVNAGEAMTSPSAWAYAFGNQFPVVQTPRLAADFAVALATTVNTLLPTLSNIRARLQGDTERVALLHAIQTQWVMLRAYVLAEVAEGHVPMWLLDLGDTAEQIRQRADVIIAALRDGEQVLADSGVDDAWPAELRDVVVDAEEIIARVEEVVRQEITIRGIGSVVFRGPGVEDGK